MTQQAPQKNTLEFFLRNKFKFLLDQIGTNLLKIGLKPNHVTLIGLAGNLAAAILAGSGQLIYAGLVALLFAPLDAVDGAMARLMNKPSKFGAFLDSCIDRYDELILLGGILFHYSTKNDILGILLTYAAACGSILVSYTRARAEGLGFSGKTGILTRVERSIILIVGLLFGYPIISIGIISILANITAIQRMHSVWNQSRIESVK